MASDRAQGSQQNEGAPGQHLGSGSPASASMSAIEAIIAQWSADVSIDEMSDDATSEDNIMIAQMEKRLNEKIRGGLLPTASAHDIDDAIDVAS